MSALLGRACQYAKRVRVPEALQVTFRALIDLKCPLRHVRSGSTISDARQRAQRLVQEQHL
jgi:hypothetical protein